jgi:hypothetical protein
MYLSLVVESAIAVALVGHLAWSCWRPSTRIGRVARWLMAAQTAAWIAFLIVTPPVPDEVFAEIDARRRSPSGHIEIVHDAPTIVAGRYSGTFGSVNEADRAMGLMTPALGYALVLQVHLVPPRHAATEPTRGESWAVAAVAFVLSMAFWNALGATVQFWRARRRALARTLDPPASIPAP